MINEKLYRNYSAGWKSLAADVNRKAWETGATVERARPFRNVVFTISLDGEVLVSIERFSEYRGLQDVYDFLSECGN